MLLSYPIAFIIILLKNFWSGTYTLEKFLPTHVNAFEFIKPALTFKKLYLAVSRSNKNAQTIIDDFNQAIIEMQQDGSYAQIISKY